MIQIFPAPPSLTRSLPGSAHEGSARHNPPYPEKCVEIPVSQSRLGVGTSHPQSHLSVGTSHPSVNAGHVALLPSGLLSWDTPWGFSRTLELQEQPERSGHTFTSSGAKPSHRSILQLCIKITPDSQEPCMGAWGRGMATPPPPPEV